MSLARRGSLRMLAIASAFVVGCVTLPVARNDQVRDYPVDRIAARTYVIHGPMGYFSVANQGFMNNPGFVVTGEGVVVIDPGSSVQAGRMVMKQIRNVTGNRSATAQSSRST